MNKIEVIMRELEKEIAELDSLYESNQETIINGEYISDSEYDRRYLQLVILEKEYPLFASENSPTKKVPNVIVDNLKKIKHEKPMLSLEKTVTIEGIEKFANRSLGRLIIEEKLDGLTVVLSYEKGRLISAVTRGNGEIGEDVLHTIRTIKNIPKVIPFKGKLTLRAEVVMPYIEFEKANTLGEYSNPRNLASGTVRQLDSSVAQSRNLEGIVFELVSGDKNHATISDDLAFLIEQGFAVVTHKEFPNTVEGLQALSLYIEEYETSIRKTLPHMIDGMVIKFNEISKQEELGYTSKHPKWAIAFKFKSLEDSTKLIEITDQVGKSGQITPVAELKTIDIDGVNISRATLHNYMNIKNKDIRIGDMVVITRANDVIPQIVKSLSELRNGTEIKKEIPTNCPSCGSITEFNGENLYCTGLNCKPQLAGKLEHFVSRNAMNIDGLGEKTIHQFFDLGIVEKISDIYYLHEKEDIICSLDKFGKKKFDNMIKGIEDSKNRPLHQLLYGLSIRLIGQSATKDLSKEFKTMDNMLESFKDLEAFKQRILSISDFGETMSNSLIDFLSNAENIEEIVKLKELGLFMGDNTIENEIELSTALEGKTFVVTGDVNHFKNRKELQEKIESLGGKVSGSVSKNTDYLINNDKLSSSSKNKKALDLGVTIISEDDFIQMI